MRKAVRRTAALLLGSVFLAAQTGGCSTGQENKTAQPAKIAVAIAHDCPQGAAQIMQAMCDDIMRQSQGGIEAVVQYWEDPLSSQADLIFVSSSRLAQALPECGALRTDYMFLSYQHMADAMNAPSILQELSEPLLERYGCKAAAAFYCGRQYLLGGDFPFIQAIVKDESDPIDNLIRDINAGFIEVRPADLSQPPLDDTLYYADTITLGASDSPAAGYILEDAGYRYDIGLLLMRDTLRERFTPTQTAYVLESVAAAKPACDQYYLQMDKQAAARFETVLPVPQNLRRAIRKRQNNVKHPPLGTELYQKLDEYSS